MSKTLDEILDKSMYKQDFWTKEVKREISDIEAKQQIKELFLEVITDVFANPDNYGDYRGILIKKITLL